VWSLSIKTGSRVLLRNWRRGGERKKRRGKERNKSSKCWQWLQMAGNDTPEGELRPDLKKKD